MVEGRHCLGADRVTQIIKFLRLDAEGQDIPTIDKMVKSYLRYVPSATLGVIVSPNGKIVSYSSHSKHARTPTLHAIVPALEQIKIWNTKTSALLASLHDAPSTAEVIALVLNPLRPSVLAAGYDDGSIRLWNLKEDFSGGDLIVTFNGHKSAVTHLVFDPKGNRLASGSKDTDIVLWDIVAEEGIVRLRAHQDQITGLAFLTPPSNVDEGGYVPGDFLVSTGKDGLIKLWDLSTNFCVETHVAHRGEVWALALSPGHETLVTAGSDGELKFWAVKGPSADPMDVDDGEKVLVPRGVVSRVGHDKPLTVKFHPDGAYLAVHGSHRNIEIFRLRTQDEIKKLLARKKKRKAKKSGAENGADQHEELEDNDITNEIAAYTTIRATAKVKSIDWDSTPSTTTVQVFPPIYNLTIAPDIPRLKLPCPLCDPQTSSQTKNHGHRPRTNSFYLNNPPRPPLRSPYPFSVLRQRNAPLRRPGNG